MNGRARRMAALLAWLAGGGLSGCALPERAPGPLLYDFGAAGQAASAAPSAAPRPVLAIQVQATPALEGHAMRYRLAYADERQLRAYALARWAMPPAELLQLRLREVLGRQYSVLQPGQGAAPVLNLELEEFSQVFAAPEQSAGLLRLRATLLQTAPGGEKTVSQHSVAVQRPAPSADAAGGVRALAAATEAAALELAQWLQSLR